VTGRRGRRCNQVLDEFKETRGYWKLKREALERSLWRTRFRRGYGPVVRQKENKRYSFYTFRATSAFFREVDNNGTSSFSYSIMFT